MPQEAQAMGKQHLVLSPAQPLWENGVGVPQPVLTQGWLLM